MSGTELLGYSLYDGSLGQCAQEIVRHIDSGDRFAWMACMNPHSYATARKDRPFQQALRGARWLLPDGSGVVLAARMIPSCRQLRERVAGPDLFALLNRELGRLRQTRVFLLGSTEENLRAIADKLRQQAPGIVVCGTCSPPFAKQFSREQNHAMLREINAAGADVLWVAMTAPKQEKWIFDHRRYLNVKFAGAVGAAFDFYSGRIRRSSMVWQRLGLEWLPRLVQEPKRLWRRMFVSAPVFLRDALWSAVAERVRRSQVRT